MIFPKELVDEIISASGEFLKKVGEFSTGFSLKKLYDVIIFVVMEVEKLAITIGNMSSEEKCELAVDLILKIVKIPVVPEFILKPLLKWLISYVVSEINKLIGKKWLNNHALIVAQEV